MDPDACLARILALVASSPSRDDLMELRDHVESLDGWLSAGGFLPERWRREAER